jgi:hypothetical protein
LKRRRQRADGRIKKRYMKTRQVEGRFLHGQQYIESKWNGHG